MIINVLVIVFTIAGIRAILFSKNGLEKSLKWLIFAFLLGYRTFEPIPGLKLHPIEILIYAAIVRIIIIKPSKFVKMPVSISILGIFFITIFAIDILTRYDQWALVEFKNSLLFILIFLIARYIDFNKSYVIKLLRAYFIIATIISTIGILEFLFPSLIANLFGFQESVRPKAQSIYFSRLAFLFWGSHLAANLIPAVFPILLLLKTEREPIVNNNFFLILYILINLFAIYLSGNRVSWIIITVLLFLTISQYKSYKIPYLKAYIGLITFAFVAYIYSQPVEGRYLSAFKALTGQIDVRYDSSGNERLSRAKIALNSIVSYPQGTGWGSQGWVHNDILQISSTNGVIPGFILLFTPVFLLLRIYRFYRAAPSEQKTILFTLIGLLIFIIISMILNGNFALVQTGVPLFVLWALTYFYIENYYQLSKS